MGCSLAAIEAAVTFTVEFFEELLGGPCFTLTRTPGFPRGFVAPFSGPPISRPWARFALGLWGEAEKIEEEEDATDDDLTALLVQLS